MTIAYFQEISHIVIEQLNWKVVVTSGFDPSCGDNAAIQNRFAKFNV